MQQRRWRGPDRKARKIRGNEEEINTMAPSGSPMVDRFYRLESKASTQEERERVLRRMEAYCQQRQAGIYWEKKNRLDPESTEQVLYILTNMMHEDKLRRQAFRLKISVSKEKDMKPTRMQHAVLQGTHAG